MDKFVILIAASRVLQIFLSLAAVRLYTAYLSKAEIGNLYLILSLVGFFSLTFVNPAGMFVNRRLHKWAADKTIVNNFAVYNLYLLVLSFFSVLIVVVLHNALKVGANIDLDLLCLLVMFQIYFNTWNQTILPSFNMLNHRVSFVAFTLVTLLLGLALSCFLVVYYKPCAAVWMMGQLSAQAIVTIAAFLYFKRLTGSEFDYAAFRNVFTRDNVETICRFTFPLVLTTFFLWTQNQSYRLIVEKHIGLEFLAFIGLGMGVSSSIASAAESLVQQIYYPMFYSEINTSDPVRRTSAWNKLAQMTIPIYVSIALLVSFLSPFLVRILVDVKFFDAYIYVIFGAWVELFRMTTGILSNVAQSEMQTKSLLKAYFVGSVLATVGVWFGSLSVNYRLMIPACLVVSGFVTMQLMYFEMRKLMVIEIGFRRVLQSMLVSVPFGLATLFYPEAINFYASIMVVAVIGAYYVGVQFFMYKRSVDLAV